MIRAGVRLDTRSLVDRFRHGSVQRVERAALKRTDQVTRTAHREIRAEMSGAGLGKFGNALGVGSDLAEGNGVHRRGNDSFSASGWIFIRGNSERTEGAIEAYTEGADIRPVKGPWLWIATDQIPKRVGRYKMTPARYNASGLAQRIGPLVFRPGRHPGEALLIVKNVTVDRFGRGPARRLPRRGAIGGSRERVDEIVAFVGIKRTSRAARANPRAVLERNASRLGALIIEDLSKED